MRVSFLCFFTLPIAEIIWVKNWAVLAVLFKVHSFLKVSAYSSFYENKDLSKLAPADIS